MSEKSTKQIKLPGNLDPSLFCRPSVVEKLTDATGCHWEPTFPSFLGGKLPIYWGPKTLIFHGVMLNDQQMCSLDGHFEHILNPT